MNEDTVILVSNLVNAIRLNIPYPSTNSFKYSLNFLRRSRTSSAFFSRSLSRAVDASALPFFLFRSPSRCRLTTSASFSTSAATSQRDVSTSRAMTVAVCRKARNWDEDIATTQCSRVGRRSELYNWPRAAAELMSREINSESDLRNFLNAGNFEVSGYTGESSYSSTLVLIF